MKTPMKRLLQALTMTLAAALLLPAAARADDDDEDRGRGERREHHGHRRHLGGHGHHEGHEGEGREGRQGRDGRASTAALRATPQWTAYAAECGSCHLAFPPSMLPAKSWSTLLGSLQDHFGENAELDEPSRKALEAWLTENAGRDVGGAPQRITTLSWWRREHDEVDPRVFQRKAVASPANCGACHPGANEGAFDEHEVKIPRDAPPAR